jgi:hypothetical protein
LKPVGGVRCEIVGWEFVMEFSCDKDVLGVDNVGGIGSFIGLKADVCGVGCDTFRWQPVEDVGCEIVGWEFVMELMCDKDVMGVDNVGGNGCNIFGWQPVGRVGCNTFGWEAVGGVGCEIVGCDFLTGFSFDKDVVGE